MWCSVSGPPRHPRGRALWAKCLILLRGRRNTTSASQHGIRRWRSRRFRASNAFHSASVRSKQWTPRSSFVGSMQRRGMGWQYACRDAHMANRPERNPRSQASAFVSGVAPRGWWLPAISSGAGAASRTRTDGPRPERRRRSLDNRVPVRQTAMCGCTLGTMLATNRAPKTPGLLGKRRSEEPCSNSSRLWRTGKSSTPTGG